MKSLEDKKVLQLVFNTEEGSKLTISIPYVRDDVTDAEISAAMDTILSNGIFGSTNGDPISKNSAQIVTTSTTEVTL